VWLPGGWALCLFRLLRCGWGLSFLPPPPPPPPPPPRPPLLAKSRLNRGAKTQNILFCENSPPAHNSRAFQGGVAGRIRMSLLIRVSGAGGALRNMMCLGIKATFSGGSLSRVGALGFSRGIGLRMCHFGPWPKWHAPLY
jgi:hypothetical protein